MAMGTGVHILITDRGSVPSLVRGSTVADIGTGATIGTERVAAEVTACCPSQNVY